MLSGKESSEVTDLSSVTFSVNSSSCLAATWNSRRKGDSGTSISSSWFELAELAEVVDPFNFS